jgi:hypothetical protein
MRGGRGQRWALTALQAAADTPARAREGMVGERGEADLVLPQSEQEVGDPVGPWKLWIGRAGTEAVHSPAPGPDQERTGLADEPDAEPAGLERQAALALKCSRFVIEQIAQEALRRPLRGARASALERKDDARAAVGEKLGDHPGVEPRNE